MQGVRKVSARVLQGFCKGLPRFLQDVFAPGGSLFSDSQMVHKAFRGLQGFPMTVTFVWDLRGYHYLLAFRGSGFARLFDVRDRCCNIFA